MQRILSIATSGALSEVIETVEDSSEDSALGSDLPADSVRSIRLVCRISSQLKLGGLPTLDSTPL